jgi:hypothetical protein
MTFVMKFLSLKLIVTHFMRDFVMESLWGKQAVTHSITKIRKFNVYKKYDFPSLNPSLFVRDLFPSLNFVTNLHVFSSDIQMLFFVYVALTNCFLFYSRLYPQVIWYRVPLIFYNQAPTYFMFPINWSKKHIYMKSDNIKT